MLALELERAAIAGTAVEDMRSIALSRELAHHLRALLRDVICGHLRPDLLVHADELLMAPADGEEQIERSGREPVLASRGILLDQAEHEQRV